MGVFLDPSETRKASPPLWSLRHDGPALLVAATIHLPSACIWMGTVATCFPIEPAGFSEQLRAGFRNETAIPACRTEHSGVSRKPRRTGKTSERPLVGHPRVLSQWRRTGTLDPGASPSVQWGQASSKDGCLGITVSDARRPGERGRPSEWVRASQSETQIFVANISLGFAHLDDAANCSSRFSTGSI